MSIKLTVDNIKCGGCANTIRTKLLENPHVNGVEVDIEQGIVTIDSDDGARQSLAEMLAHLGYPETGSVAGLKAAGAKARSIVSCAVGRIDNAIKEDDS